MQLSRRELAVLLAPVPGMARPVSLNEDSNHFWVNRRKLRLTRELIRQWVDQYANTLVGELILNVNAMRSSFPSKHRETWFSGFDPNGGAGQAFLRPLPEQARQTWFEWIRCAWQANEDKLDLYEIWIPEIRRQKMSPWVSVRMNDLHNVDQEDHPLHSSFWQQNKHLRRVTYREEQRDKALDYSKPEVRNHNFRYIEEVCERYDFDMLELDWMRFGFHLPPGKENPQILTDFTLEVRKLLNLWQKKREHRIGLAVRVPSTPTTSLQLGMDAVGWARQGLVNYVTPTNFWRTVDNNMPIDEWRKLLPKGVTLAAGLELGCNAFPGSVGTGGKAWQSNSLETARGSALSYLRMGADKIYLFNYMDSDTSLDDVSQYPPLLKQLTSPTAARRHVVTYKDTWAPGEQTNHSLPVTLDTGRYAAFRLQTGPKANNCRVRLGLSQSNVAVRLNGQLLPTGKLVEPPKPGPNLSVYEYVAGATGDGANVVELTAQEPTRIEWVEIAIP
ncbi:MAG: hypothetical protein FJW36_11815 [Acidobacteria bacterium]|nr:hypothetical protein [Acidobacteriota bacterium]